MPSEGAMEICPDCCGAGGDNNTFTCSRCDGQGMVPATPPPASADALGEVAFALDELDGSDFECIRQHSATLRAALSAMSPAGEVERIVTFIRSYAEEVDNYHPAAPGFIRRVADAIERGDYCHD